MEKSLFNYIFTGAVTFSGAIHKLNKKGDGKRFFTFLLFKILFKRKTHSTFFYNFHACRTGDRMEVKYEN